MRTVGKDGSYEDNRPAITSAPEFTIGEGILASAGPPHELGSDEESLA